MAPEDVAEFMDSPQAGAAHRTQESHRLPRDETDAWTDGGVCRREFAIRK